MSKPAGASVERVRQALSRLGVEFVVTRFPHSTRTSAGAAAALGCSVGQIAKSLVFRAVSGSRPVLVITSGANRVDTRKVEALLGEAVTKADAEFVRERTGFAIGGVAPVGHTESPAVFVDRDLLAFDEIWAAAGTPNAVFRLAPADLVRITVGRVDEVKVG